MTTEEAVEEGDSPGRRLDPRLGGSLAWGRGYRAVEWGLAAEGWDGATTKKTRKRVVVSQHGRPCLQDAAPTPGLEGRAHGEGGSHGDLAVEHEIGAEGDHKDVHHQEDAEEDVLALDLEALAAGQRLWRGGRVRVVRRRVRATNGVGVGVGVRLDHV